MNTSLLGLKEVYFFGHQIQINSCEAILGSWRSCKLLRNNFSLHPKSCQHASRMHFEREGSKIFIQNQIVQERNCVTLVNC